MTKISIEIPNPADLKLILGVLNVFESEKKIFIQEKIAKPKELIYEGPEVSDEEIINMIEKSEKGEDISIETMKIKYGLT